MFCNNQDFSRVNAFDSISAATNLLFGDNRMAYEVYWIAGSPYSWRVLLALEIKGVEYVSKLLRADKKEHKSAAYLEINPRGRVPSLKFDGGIVYESVAILAFLDRQHPEPQLFGDSTVATAKIWQSIFETESYILDPVFDIVRPVYFDQVSDNEEKITVATKIVAEEFAILDRALSTNDFLVGNKLSAADIVLFPVVMSLHRALTLELGANLNLTFLPYLNSFPAIDAWIKRIESISGYEKAYPPIWRD